MSTPQSGARTDGGAGQKQRDYSGGTYGERKALADQQAAAPLATAGADPASQRTSARPVPSSGQPPVMPGDPFGPTSRPGEPITAGLGNGGNPMVNDTDMAIRAMYRKFPHPALLQLIRQSTDAR